MSALNTYEGEPIKLLDHGHLRLVEHWGGDEQIIRAARQSTAKGFLGWGPVVTDDPCLVCLGHGVTDDRGFALMGQPYFCTQTCLTCGGEKKARKPGDEKLLAYLWKNKHSTPFEMAGATIEVQAPIMVFREWHRHRVPFGYSEMSARYVPLPDLNFVPSVERVIGDGAKTSNKQAGTDGVPRITDRALVEEILEEERALNRAAQALYQRKLAQGFPKELARTHLGVSRYSRMWATGNLRGWLGFLALRDSPNAQEEIRVYARALVAELARVFPRTMALYAEGRAA